MRFDLHTHHERCGHAYGRMEDYIEQALELGLDAVGISDHCPSFDDLQDHPTPRLKMAKSAFPEYVQEALRLKAKYQGRIEVLIGVESDIIAGRIEAYAKEYDRYPFDYIILVWLSGFLPLKFWSSLIITRSRSHSGRTLIVRSI
ncbi:PHP domain-containing protein [Paenibacillus abyssi]|uniref:Histidinol-phosphatase n=1 Tax=Paenibacillus abyssi TaxID=1340531 RepID=A0A917FNN9_9BACL|nr:PHP domain-containing protein [Paenibacillus abyssi]GGF96045.1 hypothetical protein GCM10010916_11650 [Paenibacillus abyssi]